MNLNKTIMYVFKAQDQASKAAHAVGGSMKKTAADVKKAQKANQEYSQSFVNLNDKMSLFKKGLAGLGVSAGLIGIQKVLDTATTMDNQLRLVTETQKELNFVFAEQVKISRETRTPLDANVEAYRRLGVATKELGIDAKVLLAVQKSVNQALIISGSGAQEARAGLIQFAQGLASNRLQGDELRSVLENVPRLAQAIAKGMGTNIGQIRKLASEGKLTAGAVIKAIQSQAEELESEFGRVVPTIGQALQQVRNSFLEMVRDFNNAIPVSKALASAIYLVADNIKILTAAIAALIALKLAKFVTRVSANFAVLVEGATSASAAFDAMTVALGVEMPNAVIPAFSKMMSVIKSGFMFLIKMPTNLIFLQFSLGAVASLITTSVIPAVLAFSAALATNPITWVVAGVGLLALALSKIVPYFIDIGKIADDTWKAMSQGLADVATGMKIITLGIVDLFAGMWFWIRDLLVKGQGEIAAFVANNAELFKKLGFAVDQLVADYFHAVGELAKDRAAYEEKAAKAMADTLGYQDNLKLVEEARLKLAQQRAEAEEAAAEAAKKYLEGLEKNLEKRKDEVAALRMVASGQVDSLEIAKLIVQQQKYNTDEINKATEATIRQIRAATKLQKMIDTDEDISKLTDKIAATELLLAGQAKSLELANLQLQIEKETDPVIKQKLLDQADLVKKYDAVQEQLKIQKNLAQGLADAFGDAFDSMIKGSESFRDSLGNLASQLADVILQATLIEPLKNSITNSMAGVGPGNLVTSALGFLGGMFKEGGYSKNPVQQAFVSLDSLKNVPAFASGTPNTSGFPAVLHDNEAVVPLSRGRNIPVDIRGSGGMNINMPVTVKVEIQGGANQTDPGQADKLGKQIGEAVSLEVYRILSKETRSGGMLA